MEIIEFALKKKEKRIIYLLWDLLKTIKCQMHPLLTKDLILGTKRNTLPHASTIIIPQNSIQQLLDNNVISGGNALQAWQKLFLSCKLNEKMGYQNR